ncbi:M3 family metallopeptidase [Shewanella gelidii]|uniref:Zn-dependent oligopeptidase n=1 Tax=Shewanella gelidii TaxID=1642821 RepID=A0A917NB03_9GAMM|nr:M3 family metallopeptidase [Shewanella gelidii]MCL1097954.1 M3 family metallopeptidase [Shewanella gelidii]GGI84957.1 Zn-dependent oligopeptidase [Shewanella gelidii]
MQKSIFLITLIFSLVLSKFASAVQPAELFVEQCFLYAAKPWKTSEFRPNNDTQNLLQLAYQLEAQTLGLHNINRLLKYYRRQPQSPEIEEKLLQCQIKIADHYGRLVKHDSLKRLTARLLSPQNKKLEHSAKLYAKNMNKEIDAQLNRREKSILHIDETLIKQALSQKNLAITTLDSRCKLNTSASTETQQGNNTNKNGIAWYLMQQTDRPCRVAAWKSYQGRAKQKLSRSMERILQIRETQANTLGFNSYTDFTLQYQSLSNTDLVKRFLDSQTTKLDVAPWDIGIRLAQLPKIKIQHQNTQTILTNLSSRLPAISLRFEQTTTNRLKVWHNHRYLGELLLRPAQKSHFENIRQLVIGQQFGLGQLSYKATLNTYRDISAFSRALAIAIVSFTKNSSFYINNVSNEYEDLAALGEIWLTQYIQSQLFPALDLHPRVKLKNRYQKQLNVFRAKVALNQYVGSNSKSVYPDIAQEFNNGFGYYWHQSNDYPFSFKGIVTQGPTYYKKVWQQAIAERINQSMHAPKMQKFVFDTLVLNLNQIPIEKRLPALLDIESLQDQNFKIQDVIDHL